MPEMLRDGTGSGNLAKINSNNQLSTEGVSYTSEQYSNHVDQKAYTAYFTATPTGAGDCFMYLKNTDTEELIISGVSIYVASNEIIEAKTILTGTPSGGSDITPVNSTVGSQNDADVTMQYGNDITGITHDGQLTHFRVPANNTSNVFNVPHGIIIPSNKAIGIYAVTGGIAIEMTIFFTFHSHS